MDGRTYVTDYVGDEYLHWKNGSKIIISTPTGSGKTTFVVATLLKYAVEQKKHIVYYCNRKILHNQFLVQSREKIEKFFGNCTEIAQEAAGYLHIFSYQSSELTHNYPTVSIKDECSKDTIILDPEDILYYIFDEAHYFINDAAINSGTNFWYDKKFEHSISVFLTATPKPLMVLFEGWDRLSTEENRIVYKAYKEKITALISFLDAVVEGNLWLREDDTCHEQYAFARLCIAKGTPGQLGRKVGQAAAPLILFMQELQYLIHGIAFFCNPGFDIISNIVLCHK